MAWNGILIFVAVLIFCGGIACERRKAYNKAARLYSLSTIIALVAALVGLIAFLRPV